MLRQTFGEPPPVDLADEADVAGLKPKERESSMAIGARSPNIEWPVKAVVLRGDRATIQSADDVRKWTESVGCVQTNRIEQITSDGRIIYEERCSGEVEKSTRRSFPAIDVAANEAASIKAGDAVRVAYDKKKKSGIVVAVFDSQVPGHTRVQVRRFRLVSSAAAR